MLYIYKISVYEITSEVSRSQQRDRDSSIRAIGLRGCFSGEKKEGGGGKKRKKDGKMSIEKSS